MAYIVDLIIIMQTVYIISQGRADGVVTREEVEVVLKDFETNHHRKFHRDIENSFERRVYSRERTLFWKRW